MKICRVCNIEKHLEHFRFRKDSNSYRKECIACCNLRDKNNYHKTKDTKNPIRAQKRKDTLEQSREGYKQSYHRNKHNINNHRRIARQFNKEKFQEIEHKKYIKHRDSILENRKAYLKNNLPDILYRNSIKRAKKRQAMPRWLTRAQRVEIRNFYREANRLKEESGIVHHVDHIIPLNNDVVCGLHVPWNLQILTGTENCKKHNKLLDEFIKIEYTITSSKSD